MVAHPIHTQSRVRKTRKTWSSLLAKEKLSCAISRPKKWQTKRDTNYLQLLNAHWCNNCNDCHWIFYKLSPLPPPTTLSFTFFFRWRHEDDKFCAVTCWNLRHESVAVPAAAATVEPPFICSFLPFELIQKRPISFIQEQTFIRTLEAKKKIVYGLCKSWL